MAEEKRMHGGCHVYQLRVLPDFLSRRQVRQSDEGGGGAAEQPAKLNTRDSELRGGDRLSTLFAHESGHDFDPGGRGAVPAHKDRLYGN